MRGSGLISVVILIWLLVGAMAGWQRGYFEREPTSCATVGTIVLTVLAGPLNYAGLHPRVTDCRLPQPS